ncbi:MAG: hypothetical protein FD141_1056 [Fusobacteria bacterium]|nr:MAG: hypothetical protein FD141_1056 [Fusobacteriota bacterium]KAF0229769.1 MAG: hypothetical protein FD182_159 [Fusobacteriota bacterium]
MFSMTGYGKGIKETKERIYTLELRAVNHRFLEVKYRLPKGMLFVEEKIDKFLKANFNRGSFSVFLNIENNKEYKQDFNIDFKLAEAYFKAGQNIKEHFKLSYDLSLQDIIRYPEVISSNDKELDDEVIWNDIKEALETACENVKVMRKNEGEKLKGFFQESLEIIITNIEEVDKYADFVVGEYKAKLQDRIKTLLDAVPVNEDRIAYEVAAFADKSNITEEITRLNIHMTHFKDYFEIDEPIGRKMDFLIQEMNREINTIGSKSSSTDIAVIIVTVKSELEKIREQVQNIE